MDEVIATRLEVRLREPNPIFIGWLENWLTDAESRNAKSQHKLREALQSLRSYPLPLYTGQECAGLRGFGAKLCKLIDDKLLLVRNADKTAKILPLHTSRNNESYQQEVQQVVETVKKTVLKSRKQQTKELPKEKKISKKVQRELQLEEERQRQVTMSPGSFRIELLVDTQETSGKNKRILDQTRSYLESLAVSNEVRRLTVGDFLWIARDKMQNELVLPYIVERKRMDDLASSIRDGRFHEQKHRLRQCGIQNVIYLVEDYGDNEQLGLPLESLLQALSNTQIQSGFIVVRTENHYRSMAYLQAMTRTLIRLFKDKLLISTPKECLKSCQPTDSMIGLLKFRDLYEDSARGAQRTVRELFVQQLLQLHSLSLERALAIVERYATPRQLLDAYASCPTDNEARLLLADIACGKLQRPLGEKISQCIYEFYNSEFK